MNTIDDIRKDIDELDNHLLELIQKRIILMKAIGEAKKQHNQPIKDGTRETEKEEMITQKANLLGVPVELIIKIWKIFFDFSTEIEK